MKVKKICCPTGRQKDRTEAYDQQLAHNSTSSFQERSTRYFGIFNFWGILDRRQEDDIRAPEKKNYTSVLTVCGARGLTTL